MQYIKDVSELKQMVAGIDIGGTSIVGGIIGPAADCKFKLQVPTSASSGSEVVFNNIKRVAEELLEWARTRGVPIEKLGISTAGQVDPSSGKILYATDTFPGWTGFPLQERLETDLRLEVFVENDAFAAGWGEKCFGLAQGVDDFIMITLGTGIGGALFTRGRLITGCHNLAGLIGHMTIDPFGKLCNCGGRGCLEQYASGTAMAERAVELAKHSHDGTIKQKIRELGHDFSAKDVFAIANTGDPMAQEIVAEAATYLGAGIGGLMNLLNPELVVLSGGISKSGNVFLMQVIEAAQNHSTPAAFDKSRINISAFYDDCGLVGAGAVAYTAGIERL